MPIGVIGREGDKEALLAKLLGDNSSSSHKVSVVSIVGLGGIGKTTLAQLLYNDKEVKSHFELMSWVCVSDDFDVFRISKAIFKDVGEDDKKFETLNQLQVSLAEKLSNKRFLLVLDDVWNENYKAWELLQRPFTEGAPGSKILVTTRKTKTSSVMDSIQDYHLKLLSDDEALSLFAKHASHKQNFDINRKLKFYGYDIVKNCGRLPLALIILGRAFRGKSNDEEWEELLYNEIWNLDNESEILPALKLSYYDLPPHLKQMFAYCCLFPKDYMFDKDELVLLWMAEDLLCEPNSNKSIESFGHECFEELVSRSFFQRSSNNNAQYTMHDLINDLATSVAGEFFVMLDEKMDISGRNEVFEKFHHLSYVRERYGPYIKLKALQEARHVRTFLAMPVTTLRVWDKFYVSGKVLTELLPQLQFLRVLSLANYNISEVPLTIGSLKHIRYLNFSNTDITCLPEQVGDLLNLQSLLLSGCRMLSSLPNSTQKLINLRHLDIANTNKLNNLPLGLGGLTGLQTLSKVIIGGANEFNISDLKGLLHLQGQLSIEGLHKVKNAVHAKEVNLPQKKGICDLQMEWSDVFDGSRNELTEYEVLEGLRPFEKLKSLKIVYYSGTKIPSWVGDPSFDCLTKITLRGCRSCTCLPTLGSLPSLKELFVERMDRLKRLGSELLGPSNLGVAFPSLEVLDFKNMMGWEEWSSSGGDKTETFPCLRELYIFDCPKLDAVELELLPSLKVLFVVGCSFSVLRSTVGVSSSIARLRIENIKGLSKLDGDVLEHLKALESLEISECDELTYLWESEATAYKILVSLRSLDVYGCDDLVSLGEKEMNPAIRMQSVTKVRIQHCPRLESFNCPNRIEKLEICYCPSVTSLTFPTIDNAESTLKVVKFTHCDSVELLNKFFSAVESLHISRMRLLPKGCFFHLTKLTIDGCDDIEFIPDNGYGFLPSLCLKELKISECKNLKSFPHEHLQSLASLVEMDIRYCPSLDYPFHGGLWPPNLSSLTIGGLKKPISKWGLQNFPTSLVTLTLIGENSGVVSFAKAEEDTSSSSFLPPASLTSLSIVRFMELVTLSEGLKHLTSLEHLRITAGPKLKDLPETLLPSLLSLTVECRSPELHKKCSRSKGKYWPSISQIPHLMLQLA